MVKLNKATEYGLIALGYIRNKSDGKLTSAREISTEFKLPFEILAKTLQKLKEQGIIDSTFGTRGGYLLTKDLKTINLLEFLKIMEGNVGVVSCVENQTASNCCAYETSCSIRPIMSTLNAKVYNFLSQITLDELTAKQMTSLSSDAISPLPIHFELNSEIDSTQSYYGEEP